jgi:hypothetical protein
MLAVGAIPAAKTKAALITVTPTAWWPGIRALKFGHECI